jgi:hypothetical protein
MTTEIKAEYEDDKFLVLKKEDIEQYLNYNQKLEFQECLNAIKYKRRIYGKPAVNKYYTCNQDEPYAQEVIDLILTREAQKNNK